MKVRPAISMISIDEAMDRVVEIPDWPALMEYLRREFDFWQPTEANVTATHHGFDARVGWDTYLICVDGKAALFADGPPR